MILICSAKGVRWVVEQPEGSSLPNHPRFQQLMAIVEVPQHNWLRLILFNWSLLIVIFQSHTSTCLYRPNLLSHEPRYGLDRFGWATLKGKRRNGIGYGPMIGGYFSKLSRKVPLINGPLILGFDSTCGFENIWLIDSLLLICHSMCFPDLGGTMTRAQLQALPGAQQGLVRKYIDKRGQRRHAGVPDRLKSSQSPGIKIMRWLGFEVFSLLKENLTLQILCVCVFVCCN